jgi:hypothetical protein
MSIQDFIDLCKEKIQGYIDTEDTYDIFVIWKDYWTIGSNQDGAKSLDNQRAIFATTLDDSAYFDFTLNGIENKLYMKVFTNTDNETYTITTQSEVQEEPGL